MELRAIRVGEAERERAVATLVTAFTADPFLRWIYPGSHEYLTHFPRAVMAFGGEAFQRGDVWQFADYAAVAFWMPPGVAPDGEATLGVFQRTVDPGRFEDLLGVFGQMDENHPTEPHWYLPWLGVDAGAQGQGLGSRLLAPLLDLVDAEHLPAYLDSTNPRNVPFYERHGFEVTAECRAGDAPPMISMLRTAR